MIPVTRTTLPAVEDYVNSLQEIWASGQLTNNGPLTLRLRDALEDFLGVENLLPVANGTLALQLAIKALNLKGEIITTPYSYVATTNAILWEGCDPVFVDVDPLTFCIDPALIEAAITPKTSAILATHVYGYPCDVQKIEAIAAQYGLKVIYDAAHAFGVKLNGLSILEHGECSTLSFHATKLFHTGEGGAVVARDKDIHHRLLLMSKFGHVGEDDYLDIGINAKMSELHAAMGLAVLPSVTDIIAARRERSQWYDEMLEGLPLLRPKVMDGLEYNYAYYPVIFSTHEQMMTVRAALQAEHIFPRRYFYPSLNMLPFLPESLRRPCPVSETIAQRVLALPLYPMLARKEVERITACILTALSV